MNFFRYMFEKSNFIKRKQPGISLFDLILWLAFVGAILAFLMRFAGRVTKYAKDFRAKSLLQEWQSKINVYQAEIGAPPKSLKDLFERPASLPAGASWSGKYVDKNEEFPPVDLNGNPLVYERPPEGEFKGQYSSWVLYSEDPDTGDKVSVGV